MKEIFLKTLSQLLKLKVQLCKLHSNKFMIALTQITNTEIFPLIAFVCCKLLGRKVQFINKKDDRDFLRKLPISQINYCKVINCWNATFSGNF